MEKKEERERGRRWEGEEEEHTGFPGAPLHEE